MRKSLNNFKQVPADAPGASQARSRFPAGLAQADNCLRFDLSALLLGQFVAQADLPMGANLAELGAGCGAAACQLLLLREDLLLCGLELIPEQAECARQNAAGLGLDNLRILTGDLRDPACLRHLREQYGQGQQRQFDAVMCNPPWKAETDGRPSPSRIRNLAARADDFTLPAFFLAADGLLRQGGQLFCIVAATCLDQALRALPPRLRLARLRLAHPKPDRPAAFALITAVKKKKAALTIERPWFLNS